MAVENGEWIMKGLSWNDPYRIRSWRELVNWVQEVGFLPLFANEIEGFSAEEHVSPDFWWTGDAEQDPWVWRELIAADCQVAYGKFFNKKAGFISPAWLPYFANYRRDGYDFDARWEDGLLSRREKKLLDLVTERDPEGDVLWTGEPMLSTEMKKQAGFGKEGDKNFPGTVTNLQMQLYLVIAGFRRRENRRGGAYGMPVSVLAAPESLWGYEKLSSAYDEDPAESWSRVYDHIRSLYPHADDAAVRRLAGRMPR